MKTPLISIVVPCYNVEKYINNSLNSVYNQTYENWECILVDDGSIDKTKEKIDVWLEKDDRFKYFYQKNKGLSGARNSGLKLVKGEFVYFFDSDDLLKSIALTSLLELMTDSVDIVFGQNAITNGQNDNVQEIMKHYPETKVLHKNDKKSLLKLVIERPLSCVAWNRLYRLSFLEEKKITFEPGLLHEDELWFFETVYYSRAIILNNTPTYFYNNSNVESITNNFGPSNLRAYLKIINILYQKYYLLKHRNKDTIASYIIFLMITTMTHAYKNLTKLDKKIVNKEVNNVFRKVNFEKNKLCLNEDLDNYFSQFLKIKKLPADIIYVFLKEFYSLNLMKIFKRKLILFTAFIYNFRLI